MGGDRGGGRRLLGPVTSRHGLALAAAVPIALAARSVAATRSRECSIFAHRGFMRVAPENTVEAVRYAAPRADGVEVDVRRCGSGELVCVHDPDLERVAGVDRRVADTDFDTLRRLPVEGTDATVASLEAILAAVPDGTTITLELKERGLAADAVAAVERHGVDATISSFDPVVLGEVRAQDDSIPLAYLFRSASEVDRALELAAAHDCEALHPRADLVFRTAVLPRARRRDLAVTAWSVDATVAMTALALVGVDGVFADRPPRGGNGG